MKMFIYTITYLAGLLIVRINSAFFNTTNPLGIFVNETTKNVSGDSSAKIIDRNELHYAYFCIMCSTYTALFGVGYLGLTLSNARCFKNMQGTIDATFTVVILLALQLTFIHARYHILMVVPATFVGSVWAILLVNVAKLINWNYVEAELLFVVEPCTNCCERQARDRNASRAPMPARPNILVY